MSAEECTETRRRTDEAVLIESGHILTRALAGVLLREADGVGYRWRLEHRVGGMLVVRSPTFYLSRRAALSTLRRAAYAHQASIDADIEE